MYVVFLTDMLARRECLVGPFATAEEADAYAASFDDNEVIDASYEKVRTPQEYVKEVKALWEGRVGLVHERG